MGIMTYREANQVLWRGCRPGHNGTQFSFYASSNAAGIANLIPAHATLTTYITYFWVWLLDNTLQTASLVARVAPPAIAWYLWEGVGAVGYKGANKACSLWPPVELLPTYTLDLSLAVGAFCRCGAMGWRE